MLLGSCSWQSGFPENLYGSGIETFRGGQPTSHFLFWSFVLYSYRLFVNMASGHYPQSPFPIFSRTSARRLWRGRVLFYVLISFACFGSICCDFLTTLDGVRFDPWGWKGSSVIRFHVFSFWLYAQAPFFAKAALYFIFFFAGSVLRPSTVAISSIGYLKPSSFFNNSWRLHSGSKT